jgi:hypothetical protein
MLTFIHSLINGITNVASNADLVDGRIADIKTVAGISETNKTLSQKLKNIVNNHTQRKYKSVAYRNLSKAGAILTSSKMGRIFTLAASTFAFVSLAVFPPLAIAAVAISATAFVSSVIKQTIQKRNFDKVKDEEQALEKLVKNKHKSIEIAQKINLSPEVARQIGLTSILKPEQSGSPKLSKFSRQSLIEKQKTGSLTADEKLMLKKFNSDIVLSQKNEEGRTTAGKAIRKTLTSNSAELMASTVCGVGLNILAMNPIGVGISLSSAVISVAGDSIERYELSNHKQILKNSVEHFRTRDDVDGYDSLAEIQAISRRAKLECKALEKLAMSDEFLKAKDNNNIALMSKLVKSAKLEVVIKEKALSESPELRNFSQEREKLIDKKVEQFLENNFESLENEAKKALGNNDDREHILSAMREIAIHQITKEVDELTNKQKETLEQKAIEDTKQKMQTNPASMEGVSEEKYINQDNQSLWQKTKKIFSDLGNSINIFKNEELKVEEPLRLLTRERFQSFAIHKDQVRDHSEHLNNQQEYQKKTSEVLAKEVSHMKDAFELSKKVTGYLSANSTPTVVSNRTQASNSRSI